jgi:hypothetical protein
MINILFRIFAVALLLVIIFAKDINFPKYIKQPLIQLYLGICVILTLLLVDNMTGFILGICLLIVYFKVYNMELQNKNKQNNRINESKNEKPNINTKHEGCPLDNYDEKFSQKIQTNKIDYDDKHLTQLEYTTSEHLLSAQNNIYDLNHYNKEILGIEKGIYNENVYGPQGLNSNNVHFQGNDNSMNLLGSLHFAILEKE